jgi:hypothetical protein
MSVGIKEASIAPEITIDEPELIPPPEKADAIDLSYYIRRHLQAGDRIEAVVKGIERKATIHRFYAGLALHIIWSKESKDRKWVVWCKNHDLNVGTCYEAIRLYQRAISVENVRTLSITEARKKYQTNKKTFVPEGAKPQAKKPDAKDGPKIKYEETENLKALRTGIESVVEAVTEVDADDWKNADPETYISQIDGLVEKLKQAKQAILVAQRAAVAELHTTAKITAKATVTKRATKAAKVKSKP